MTIRDAMLRILRPLVRLLIGTGVTYPAAAEWLRELYVQVAAAEFRLPGKRITDSRVSLLTGVQRRDVKAIRSRAPEAEADTTPGREGAGHLPRVLARWQTQPAYLGANGKPRPLPRFPGSGGPSFEDLVADVSQDIHPRTVLDELLRLGMVVPDPGDAGLVRLQAEAFLPSGDRSALLGYLGANLGDHAEAAAANVLAAPSAGPFFERAVHYNQLTPESVADLKTLAAKLQMSALETLNARALALQTRDRDAPGTSGRFRCGAFVYHEDGDAREEFTS